MLTCLHRRQMILQIVIVFWLFSHIGNFSYVWLKEYFGSVLLIFAWCEKLLLVARIFACCDNVFSAMRILCCVRYFFGYCENFMLHVACCQNFLLVARIFLLLSNFFFLLWKFLLSARISCLLRECFFCSENFSYHCKIFFAQKENFGKPCHVV